MTKNAQIANVDCRFSRRLCVAVGGRDDGGFFRPSDGFFFTKSEFHSQSSHGEMRRCTKYILNLHLLNLNEMR